MTIHVKNGSVATSISRRGFVAGSAGLTFAFTLGGLGRGAAIGETKPTEFNAWVSIAPDDTVTIICPSAEMGQGVYTSLPLILAEELDADWSKVRVEFAPANPKLYGNPHYLFKGAQITAASVSVPGYFMPLRMAGAQARRVLLDAASAAWGAPVSELTTDKSTIIHKKFGRRMSYGEVVSFAKVPTTMPKISERRSEEAVGVQADRPQGSRPSRRAGEGDRQGAIRHRRACAGHDLRLGAAVADGRRQAQGCERPRGDEDQGRHQGDSAAVRRGGVLRYVRRRPPRRSTRSR